MFKKNSWIVALLLALSFTAFFVVSCVDAYQDPDTGEEETLTELVGAIGDFNYVAGDAANQKGWATDGHSEKQSAKGYKASDWKQAKYLILTLKGDEGFKGGFTLGWGGEPRGAVPTSNPGWNNKQLVNDGGTVNAGMGLTLSSDKKTATIDLTKALADQFYFFDEAVTELKLYILYYQGVDNLVESAALYKSDAVEPFVPVTSVTQPVTAGAAGVKFKLEPTVTPANASKQKVIWSIVGFLPKGSTDAAANWLTIKGKPDGTATEKADYASSKTALLDKVDFITETTTVYEGDKYMDYSVYPPEELTDTSTATTQTRKSTDTILATAGGKVRVQALIVGGGAKDAEGNDTDYKTTFDITIRGISTPASVDLSTAAGVTNNGGGANVTGATNTSFTVENAGSTWGYGSGFAQFPVTFTTGKTLADVAYIYFDLAGVSGDVNSKNALLFVSNSMYASNIEDTDYIAIVNGALGNDGTQDVTVGGKFAIDATKVTAAAANNGNSVYMVITIWAGNDAKYTVSNVKITYWDD